MNDIDPMDWLKKIFLKPLEHPFFWIVLVILNVYLMTLSYNIVCMDDDDLVVSQYSFNRNLTNIPQAFQEDIFRNPVGQGSFYRPIERLTFMFDAQFGQGSIIFMSHLSNMLLHIASMSLLFLFLLKLKIKKEAALLFSLIFAVHPLTAQTVAFISGRNDSLLAIFIFPALIFFLNYLQTQKRKDYIFHLTFFILALFTKETAVVLPLVCIAYILIFVNLKKILVNLRPYFYLLAGWGSALIFWFLIRREVLHNFIGNANYHPALSIFKNFPSLIPALGKVFLPFNLSVFPVMKDMSLFYGLASLALLIIWLILAKDKNYKLIIFGVLWFLLFIFLTLIKPIDITPEFSENRIYLPMLGFIFVILGLGMPKFLKVLNQEKIILALSITIILVFSSVTIYRNRYYKDNVIFWQNVVKTSPSYAFGHNNLGAMYYLDKNLDAAEVEYKKALEIDSRELKTHNNLGLIYMDRNKFKEADEEFDQELSFNPLCSVAYENKALLYNKMGKTEDSLSAWKKALEIDPSSQKALFNLFNYYQKKDKEDAIYWAKEIKNRIVPLPPEMQKLINPLRFE